MNSLEFYQETLQVLIIHKVNYLVVGGYAVNSYGFMRSTGDMDLWIDNGQKNLKKLSIALLDLKYSPDAIKTGINELSENRNISLNYNEFFKIEFISFLSSTLLFTEAYNRKIMKSIMGLSIDVINFDDLCNLKIKSGRNKDLLDVKELKRIKRENNK